MSNKPSISEMKSNLINYDAVPGKTARQIEAMSDKTIIRLHNQRFPNLGSFLKHKRDGGMVKGYNRGGKVRIF
tara:strand:- start:23 stop:241 length:219 start_codon:yes stop_codon:yes gene_type:complete